jgi:hypothetical protein
VAHTHPEITMYYTGVEVTRMVSALRALPAIPSRQKLTKMGVVRYLSSEISALQSRG